jgi:hypothetical protein
MRIDILTWFGRVSSLFGCAALLLVGTGCGSAESGFCRWETVSNSNNDGFVPWWDMDGSVSDANCLSPNACGGCSVLAQEPGSPCGRCGGVFVCDGTDSVVCDDPCSELVGCSDGEREGFMDTATFPNIAACAGGWSEAGILDTQPQCNRLSGDDTINTNGSGCSAADLCAEGWHVCSSLSEIDGASSVGCAYSWENGTFWVAAVSGDGSQECGTSGADDLFGCGTEGVDAELSCSPLSRSSGDKCGDLPDTWECPGGMFGSSTEAEDVKKSGPEGGGVLCCRIEPIDPTDPDGGVPDGGR